MALRDLTSDELGAFAASNDSSLIDAEAPNNTIYDADNDRVLSLPQSLDDAETKFIIDRDIDGKTDFFGFEAMKQYPKLAFGDNSVTGFPEFDRGVAFFFAASPQDVGEWGVEQAELALTEESTPATDFAAISPLEIASKPQVAFRAITRLFDKEAALLEGSQLLIERNKKYMAQSGYAKREGDGIAHDLGQGFGSLLASLGVAAGTRSPATMIALFGGLQKSRVYREAREAGLDPAEASDISTIAGLAEGALEKVGMDRFLHAFKGNSAVKRFIQGALIEGVQEASQQGSEELITEAAGVRNQPWETITENILYSAALGSILGGPANVAIGAFVQKEAEEQGLPPDQAKKLAKYAEENVDLVQEDMAEFIRKEVSPIAADQPKAMEFMKLMQKFDNRVDLVDPAALEPTQRAAFDEYLNYFNSAVTSPSSREAVEKDLFNRIISQPIPARMNEESWRDLAMGASKLVGARADAASRALGITPKQWFESKNLRVEVSRTPEQAKEVYQAKLDDLRSLPQEETEEVDPEARQAIQNRLDDARAVPKPQKGQKKPIIAWLRKQGGVQLGTPLAGELYSMGINNKTAPGLFKKGKPKGASLVGASERTDAGDLDNIPASEFNAEFGVVAIEDGNGYVDRNWLLDQIRDETFGKRLGDELKVPVADESFIQALDQAGLDYRTATADQVLAALGTDGDVLAAARAMGENLTPKQTKQVLGILEANPDFTLEDAIAEWQERAAIMGERGSLRQESPWAQEQMKKPASWIIRDKKTSKAVMETFSQDVVDKLNTSKYEAVPILEYLRGLNEEKVLSDEKSVLKQEEQTVLPGAERITDRELAERKMQERLRSRKEQQPMDVGMFGDEAKQGTLFQKQSPQASRNIITKMQEDSLLYFAEQQMGAKSAAALLQRAKNNTLTESDKQLPNGLGERAEALSRRYSEATVLAQREGNEKGSITFAPDETIIRLFENADPSTLLHELGHLFLRDMRSVAAATDRPMVKRDYQVVKQWLGVKGNTFTEQQEEKFARGFEAYLREGNSPSPELDGVFARFKEWLTAIYRSIRDLDVEISDEIRQVFDRMLGGDFARTEEQITRRNEQQLERDYAKVALPPPSSLPGDTGKVFRDIGGLANDAFTPVSTRLGSIDVKLKHAVRKFLFRTGLYSHEDRVAVKGFVEAVGDKFEEADYRIFDLALKNRDTVKAEELIEKYGIQKEWGEVRKVLDDLYNEALDVGLDMGYVQDYFPRQVKRGTALEYMAALRKRADWGEIQLALEEADPHGDFTVEEKASFVNTYLRGFTSNRLNLTKPSFTKERKIDYVTPEFNQYYDDSMSTLLQYIGGLRHGIESRKLFGKSEKDTEHNIGKYVLSLIEDGTIAANQEQELARILKAVAEPTGTRGAVAWAKNASYIYLMGNLTSAITQIQDLAFSLAFNGYYRTTGAFLRSVVRRPVLRKEDIGIENILQEFEDNTRASNAVRKVFRYVGLEHLDNIGKETYITAAYSRLRAANKKGAPKWKQHLKDVFGPEAAQVAKDLENKVMSENVKYLLFSELSDVQPISLAEMPIGYLRGGNGRVFYMLKTYTVKQIDIYRNKIFAEIASGDPKRMAVGVNNLVQLAVALMVMGMASDALKDLILGRPIEMDDLITDNILKLFTLTKYQIYKGRQDGIAQTFWRTLFVPPAAQPIDDVMKDVIDIGFGDKDIKDSETAGKVPFIGKFYYWWYGGGRTKIEKE